MREIILVPGYPFTLNDKLLQDEVMRITNAIILASSNEMVAKYSALAQIGLTELNNRQQDRMYKLAFFANIVALIATAVSLLSVAYYKK
jgi:hypothetical protein